MLFLLFLLFSLCCMCAVQKREWGNAGRGVRRVGDCGGRGCAGARAHGLGGSAWHGEEEVHALLCCLSCV